jgi:hypothetical protein
MGCSCYSRGLGNPLGKTGRHSLLLVFLVMVLVAIVIVAGVDFYTSWLHDSSVKREQRLLDVGCTPEEWDSSAAPIPEWSCPSGINPDDPSTFTD